jgi:predicted transcriptional regulator
MGETQIDADQLAILRLLENAKNGFLKASEIRKKLLPRMKKGSEAVPRVPDVDHALATLIARGDIEIIGESKEASGAAYRLTEDGKAHNQPLRPDFSDQQLQAQEAFILLQIFRVKEPWLTRSDLNKKLDTKTAVAQLELDFRAAPETITYHLRELVRKNYIDKEKESRYEKYRFNPEHGPTGLATAKQHDAVTFNMNGEMLNALVAALYGARASEPQIIESPRAAEPAPEPMPVPKVTSLEPSDVTKCIEQLRSNEFTGKDMIPIHAVRKSIASRHGDHAASHGVLDQIIKNLWSDGRLSVIAISDNRDATQQELNDSIPGMNETLFYIVVQ